MKITIEFYRTRDIDAAHALVGRESVEVVDLADAVQCAQDLARTLDMPQRPDAMTITDGTGAALYSGTVDPHKGQTQRAVDGDTSGTRRRAKAEKLRNQIL
jgi:hypothetical protein